MRIEILLETLSCPEFQRRPFINEFGGIDDTVACWHVTEADNAASILRTGLKAKECQQGRATRQTACYLFVDRSDINADTLTVLGIKNPQVLKVVLTAEQLLSRANYDGMFNSFDCAWSAIQYLNDVSPEQISLA